MKVARATPLPRRAAAALPIGGIIAGLHIGSVDAAIEGSMPDSDLPIIDPHHHLWDFPAVADRPARTYGLKEFLADAGSGHKIMSSVFVECLTSYRTDGPDEMRSLGETEFVAKIADESASGRHSQTRVAAAIVSHVDLALGPRAKAVLEAHIATGNGRVKGIRNASAWDEYPVMGRPLDVRRKDLLMSGDFRSGFAALAPLGLLFEAWVFHPQLAQVENLAHAFPETSIVLDHLGTPLGVGPYAGQTMVVFAAWSASIRALAKAENVKIKLGGLGMPYVGLPQYGRRPEAKVAELADAWRPYIETCLEAFGPQRCMFESNFPPDGGTCTYGTMWSVFKHIAKNYSADEKRALFSGTAAVTYGLAG